MKHTFASSKRYLCRLSIIALSAVLMLSAVGCVNKSEGFDVTREITVVSREDGSGTRGAFCDIFGVYTKDDSGAHIDATYEEAIITNNTAVMLYSVSTNPYAIGYISLGSMNDAVKPVAIDGVYASIDTIKQGSYNATRAFNIVTAQNMSDAASDFIAFILSSEGQTVVEDTGYVPAYGENEYSSSVTEGKIVIGGSSSVTPVMEKLKEAYLIINPNVTIEIQQSDSTTGISSVSQGICDIGMSSRELKESETGENLTATPIAYDGIVIIINHENSVDSLTKEEIREIFTGEELYWKAFFEGNGL